MERTEQIAWVLEHARDLDADFLAFYGIDLEEQDIDGPRYLALAHRTPAYQGVMAARIEAQNEEESQSAPRQEPPPVRSSDPAPPAYQSAAALAARFPDEIELVKVV